MVSDEDEILERLYVDENKVDKQLLYNALNEVIGIDKRSGKMRPYSEFFERDIGERIILRLLYKQAAIHLHHLERNQAGENLDELSDSTHSKSKYVKKKVKSYDFIEYDESKNGYYIPGHRLAEAIDYLT